jgi:hypothetical protein
MIWREPTCKLARHIARYQSFIKLKALIESEGDPQLAQDLEQEARIELWKFGSARIHAESDSYIEGVIVLTMRNARRTDRIQGGGSWNVVGHLRIA